MFIHFGSTAEGRRLRLFAQHEFHIHNPSTRKSFTIFLSQALLAASQLDDDDDVRFHAAVALGILGATSKVAQRQLNGFNGKQHMPDVIA